MLDSALELASTYSRELWLAGIASLAVFAVSLLVIPLVVIRLPADYFAQPEFGRAGSAHPSVSRLLAAVGKNLLGAALVILGAVMLFVPGQGVLTMLIGVMLLDFPGKKRLERKLIETPTVLKTVNGLRRRAGKEAFRL